MKESTQRIGVNNEVQIINLLPQSWFELRSIIEIWKDDYLKSRKEISEAIMETPIRFLLGDEIFLIKVLSLVMEDGLHECRQVCRQWNNVCKKLPVTLWYDSLYNMCEKADVFPNATSLKVRPSMSEFDLSKRTCVKPVKSFSNLKHLDITLNVETLSKLVASGKVGALDCIPSIRLTIQVKGINLGSLGDIRHLRNLTELEIEEYLYTQIVLDIAPVGIDKAEEACDDSLPLPEKQRWSISLSKINRFDVHKDHQ